MHKYFLHKLNYGSTQRIVSHSMMKHALCKMELGG